MLPRVFLIWLAELFTFLLLNNIFFSFEESLNIFTCDIIHLLQHESTTHQSLSQMVVVNVSILAERVQFVVAFKTYLLQFIELFENGQFV